MGRTPDLQAEDFDVPREEVIDFTAKLFDLNQVRAHLRIWASAHLVVETCPLCSVAAMGPTAHIPAASGQSLLQPRLWGHWYATAAGKQDP